MGRTSQTNVALQSSLALQWGSVIRDGSGLEKIVPYIRITLYEKCDNYACDVNTISYDRKVCGLTRSTAT